MAKTAVKTSKPGAKLKGNSDIPSAKPSTDYDEKYKVEDGLRTLTRAEELRGDKGLMDKIAAHASEQAEIASRAKMLVARGLISDKQSEKLQGKVSPDVNKAPDADKVANAQT